ncbi:MAG: M23 family metallopeptidase [Brevinema sp.]
MRKILLTLLIFSIPAISRAEVLVLPLNTWGKLANMEWNGTTPLAITTKKDFTLTAIANGKAVTFTRELITNHGKTINLYTPSEPLTNQSKFSISVIDHKKDWVNKTYKINVKLKISTPQLQTIAISDTITHGGSGLVVVKSELAKNLQFLGVVDEKDTPFYPRTYIKDGYYVILFPWYSDHSSRLSRQKIVAIDKAGNIATLPIETKPILRDYVKKKIMLPKNYAAQKAKELSLSKEEAKKLEGNITAINKVLASTRTFNRWKCTRTTNFQSTAKTIISKAEHFSNPSMPFPNAYTTATYGDRRTYYYQEKIVRTSVHRGLDLARQKNSPIYALMDGKVIYADWNSGNGKTIYIDHGLGVYSMYAHNEELLVDEGQKVKSGQQIAISGTTGQSTGDHLHLSILVQGLYVEPKEWLSQKNLERLFHKPLRDAQEFIRTNK